MRAVSILGVHGVRNHQPGMGPDAAARELARWWGDALCHGLGRTTGIDISVAYYAHRLARGAAQGNGDLTHLYPEAQQDVLRWAATLGAPDQISQGRLTAPIRQVVDWVAGKYGLNHRIVQILVGAFFGEVHIYFTDDERRARSVAHVAHALEQHQPRVVIAHSLGSVVAYETLWTHPQRRVDLLLTLGSPLAMPDVIFDRLRVHSIPGRPPGVARWVNIADPGDFIAVPLGGIPTRFTGVAADITDAVHAFDMHRVANYLSCGATAGILAAYL